MAVLRLAALLVLVAAPALAQETYCAPRENIVGKLESKYGEQLAGSGLTASGAVIEIFANPETGTWTVLITGVDGNSCVPVTGGNWVDEHPLVEPSGITL